MAENSTVPETKDVVFIPKTRQVAIICLTLIAISAIAGVVIIRLYESEAAPGLTALAGTATGLVGGMMMGSISINRPTNGRQDERYRT